MEQFHKGDASGIGSTSVSRPHLRVGPVSVWRAADPDHDRRVSPLTAPLFPACRLAGASTTLATPCRRCSSTPAVFAEFEADLLKMRTREGMAIACSRGKLKGKQPKLTTRQQAELADAHQRQLRHRRPHKGLLEFHVLPTATLC